MPLPTAQAKALNTEVTEDAEENVKGWSMDSLDGPEKMNGEIISWD